MRAQLSRNRLEQRCLGARPNLRSGRACFGGGRAAPRTVEEIVAQPRTAAALAALRLALAPLGCARLARLRTAFGPRGIRATPRLRVAPRAGRGQWRLDLGRHRAADLRRHGKFLCRGRRGIDLERWRSRSAAFRDRVGRSGFHAHLLREADRHALRRIDRRRGEQPLHQQQCEQGEMQHHCNDQSGALFPVDACPLHKRRLFLA